MHLSKNGGTYALRCHCGCYNLSFLDHGVELHGTVTCVICGAAAQWSDLVQGCADARPAAHEAEAGPAAHVASG